MSKGKRKVFWSILMVSFLCIVFGIWSNLSIVWGSQPYIYKLNEIEKTFEVAIVLGAAVYGQQLSPVFHDRVVSALTLYRQGRVKKILVSGDHGRKGYDEVNAAKKFLLAKGMAPQDLFLDHAGFSTFDTMARARKIFQIGSAVIVTQDFHLHRSVFLARQNGINAVGHPADLQEYLYIRNYRLREILARIKARFEVLIGRQPVFLGQVIDIRGDGRLSWD